MHLEHAGDPPGARPASGGGPSLQTSSHSPYGRVSHRTVFICGLLPTGLEPTHISPYLKNTGGKQNQMWYPQRRAPTPSAPGRNHGSPCRGGTQQPHTRSEAERRNQGLHGQRPLMRALGWLPHTIHRFKVILHVLAHM